MNKKTDRKSRIALTLLFAGITFAVVVLFLLFQIGIIIFLFKVEILTVVPDVPVKPSLLIFLLVLFCLVIGAGVSFLLSRILTGPINKIINCLNQLTGGNFKARLEFGNLISRHPTIVELTGLFNAMAETLDHNKILKTDFINNFSHEFKTPLVSIAGFAKLLKREDLSQNQRTEYALIIEEESKRLSLMAESMLKLVKIENQATLSQTEAFSLSEQIRNTVLLLENKWNEKKLEPVLDFDEIEIVASKELLQQVWLNLIDNAVKFSFPETELEISAQEKDDGVLVSVSNFGQEIPQKSMPYIFHKFYQADESHAGEGNGIGLAVVQKIVSLHGGTVSAQSFNEKTTFEVWLPKQ